MFKKPGLVFILWFLVHSIVIIHDGMSDRGNKADVAVVMRSSVNADGTISSRLEANVILAFNLFKSGRVKTILVSGMTGDNGYNEAEIMKLYLVSKGVPDSVVFVDNLGYNTAATVKNSLEPAKQNNWKSILVVSQYYHITRAKMFYRKEGFQSVDGAGASSFGMMDFYYIFREFWAFYIGLI